MWKSCMETGDPYDVSLSYEIVDSLETDARGQVECRVRRRDGMWRWMVLKGRPVIKEENKIDSWVCTITEVEELVRVSPSSFDPHDTTLMSRCDGIRSGVTL